MPSVLTREMALTREEFLREMPGAIGHDGYEIEGDTVSLSEPDGGRVRILITDKGTAHRGSLVLPVLQVDFEFLDMSDEQVRHFMQRWDDHMQRLGGG